MTSRTCCIKESPTTDYGADRRMRRGLALSSLLHGAVAVVALLHPVALAPPVALTVTPPAIPIDLVEWRDEPSAPPARAIAALPQQRAPETAQHPARLAVPVPTPQPVPADPLVATLDRLSHLTQPPVPQPPSPQNQTAVGMSSVTAGNGRVGSGAALSLRDYLRAQIERRWVMQETALLRNDWVVRLHLVVDRDGILRQLDIVDDPRLDNSDYRAFALSARNAARLSAPFSLPPGTSDEARDLVLEFNPRKVQQ